MIALNTYLECSEDSRFSLVRHNLRCDLIGACIFPLENLNPGNPEKPVLSCAAICRPLPGELLVHRQFD